MIAEDFKKFGKWAGKKSGHKMLVCDLILWKLADYSTSDIMACLSLGLIKRKGLAHVKERLDKAIGNIDWRMKFP